MTLLGRFKKIFKKSRPGFIFMIPVFLGCDTSNDIGLQYQLQSDVNVQFVEFTLPATNIKIDSIRTDEGVSENRILIGNYTDGLTGSVTAESYFSVFYTGGNIPNRIVDKDFTFDSVRFALRAYNSIPKNIFSTQSFSLYQLQDTLTSLVSLSNRSEPLGDLITDFEIGFDGDTLTANFELPKEFGQRFFDIAQVDSTQISSTPWPSFGLVANGSSNSLSQIVLSDDTTAFYLYVTDPDGIVEVNTAGDTTFRDTTYVATYGLSTAGVSPHFTSLQRDPSFGLFGSLNDRDTFSLDDGRTLIDPLAGITTGLRLGGIKDFLEENDPVDNPIIINNAVLSFEIEENSIRDTLENFYSFFLDISTSESETEYDFFGPGLLVNTFRNLIMTDNSYFFQESIPMQSSLNDDKGEIEVNPTQFIQFLYRNYHDTDLREELGISDGALFIQDLVTGAGQEIDGLVFLSDDDITLSRTIFKPDGIKLRIYYTEVSE